MIGGELKEARIKLGLTQAELAAALGLAKNTITRYEIDDLTITRLVELAIEYLLLLKELAKE